MTDGPDPWTGRIAGILLLAGTVVFFAGAGLFVSVLGSTSLTHPESFDRVAASPEAWLLTSGLLAAGVVVTLFGLALVAALAADAGERSFAPVGLVGFLLGTVLWMIDMAFRVTVFADLAADPATALRPIYDSLFSWVRAMSDSYIALAHLSLGAYGASIMRGRFLPRELGWFAVAYSALILILFLATASSPPFLVHFVPLVLGLALLVRK